MDNLEALVRGRRSVRTYVERSLSREDVEKLMTFAADIPNPYALPIEFRLLSTRDHRLPCPVVVGADWYVAGKMKKAPHCNEAFGYSFEKLVLYAQSLGIGTVWVGGTMDRSAFEKAIKLGNDEVMPCMSPLGYPAEKMSFRESMMRKGIKANERMPFESLFFSGNFDTPLSRDAAGELLLPLEMVRLAPSAVNKQPWRLVVTDNAVHFYLKRTKGWGGEAIDMQKIDLGIAMCHFAMTAHEQGMSENWTLEDPGLGKNHDLEYIASYQL